MSVKSQRSGLLAVEKALVLYLLLTFAYIIIFWSRIDHFMTHLVTRGFLLLLVSVMPYLEKNVLRPDRIRTIRIFLPFLVLPFLYNETDTLNNLLFRTNLDPVFSNLEMSLFGRQFSLDFANRFHGNLFADAMYFGYFSYYCLSLGIPAYIYFKYGRSEGERFAFIIIVSFLIYYLIYIVIPVAGPQFYFTGTGRELPRGYIFGPVMRFISARGEGRTAAFPSSHVSICLMLLYGCILYARKLLPLIIPVAILLLLSTVYLRAHYVIDVIAGILFTPPVWMVSSYLYIRTSGDKSMQKSMSPG